MLGYVPSTVEIIARFSCLCQLFFKVFAKFFLCKFFVFFAANLLTWLLLRAIIICVDRSGQQPSIGDLHSGSAVDSDSTCGGSIPSSPTKNHSQTRMVFLFFRPHFRQQKAAGTLETSVSKVPAVWLFWPNRGRKATRIECLCPESSQIPARNAARFFPNLLRCSAGNDPAARFAAACRKNA